jgi:hypothetical protein
MQERTIAYKNEDILNVARKFSKIEPDWRMVQKKLHNRNMAHTSPRGIDNSQILEGFLFELATQQSLEQALSLTTKDWKFNPIPEGKETEDYRFTIKNGELTAIRKRNQTLTAGYDILMTLKQRPIIFEVKGVNGKGYLSRKKLDLALSHPRMMRRITPLRQEFDLRPSYVLVTFDGIEKNGKEDEFEKRGGILAPFALTQYHFKEKIREYFNVN